MNNTLVKEQIKVGQNEKAVFAKLNNQIFYKQSISNSLGADGFCIYTFLSANKNALNHCILTSLRFISDSMNYSNLNTKKQSIISALSNLKELKYIDFTFDLNKIKESTMLEIKIIEVGTNFIKLYNDDYILFESLPSKHFIVYMMLRAYFNKESGYAFPTIAQISKFTNCTDKTANKIVIDLEYLELLFIKNEGWRKSPSGINVRSNNMYTIDFDGKSKFIKQNYTHKQIRKIFNEFKSKKEINKSSQMVKD